MYMCSIFERDDSVRGRKKYSTVILYDCTCIHVYMYVSETIKLPRRVLIALWLDTARAIRNSHIFFSLNSLSISSFFSPSDFPPHICMYIYNTLTHQ